MVICRLPLLAMLLVACVSITSCIDSIPLDPPAEGYADLVVFGHVFTSEATPWAEAFAVKDGKYVAVGSADDVRRYIDRQTKVIVHQQGMVMAGCTEGHGHYLMSNFYTFGKHVINIKMDDEKGDILAAVRQEASTHPDYIFGFGFDYNKLKEEGMYPTCTDIDNIISDVPVFLQDSEGHKGLTNTYCLRHSGILNPDGTVRDDFKYKEYVVIDRDFHPTGLLLEQAATYVRSHSCVPTDDASVWQQCAVATQQKLNQMGYTSAIEGWANKFGMTTYDVLRDMDAKGALTLNVGMAFEIENLSPHEVDSALRAAVEARDKYATEHVLPHFIKLFEDGTPETGTGFMVDDNTTGSHGHPIWAVDELKAIAAKANGEGLSLHIHAMGDSAVKSIVDAYESVGGNRLPHIRNQIVHLRNVCEEDYDRMARNGIVVSSGVLWHLYPLDMFQLPMEKLTELMAEHYWHEGYPYQSFINHGVHTSIHTDAPASSGSPTDPFGIMEVAVRGTFDFPGAPPFPVWNHEECVCNRSDFLRSLTIEGAYQMGLEHTRGSIAPGKYADFLLLNQDVTTCADTLLHNTRVLNTFFEGRCVYPIK